MNIANGVEHRVEFLKGLVQIIETVDSFFNKGSFEHNKLMAKCLVQKCIYTEGDERSTFRDEVNRLDPTREKLSF
jgi:hypothetical protein